MPFFPSKAEIELDIERWNLRGNVKSISKNIISWGSQVHFLFCAAFASLAVIVISKKIGNYEVQRLQIVQFIFWFLFIAGILDNIRLVLYDLQVKEHEKKLL